MDWGQLKEKLTNWELWPFKLRYLPIIPVWLWYCLRARSFWFFTPSNPTITFGGFEGEGKREMYEQLPEHSYPATYYVRPSDDIQDVLKNIRERFEYPFCVKPDVGMKGLLFRKIDDEEAFKFYHQHMPVEYIVQELVSDALEVSVFYYRFPDQQKGFVTGFIQKDLMEVRGDGTRSLMELLLQHPKAKYRLEEMKLKHAGQLDTIISKDEVYILTYAANLNRGASFTSLHHLIDKKLTEIFDKISHSTSFYYGRYDLKCNSVDELKNGKFSILEFNGSGAEPNHVYNCGYSWFAALRVFLFHWKKLYQISKYNHSQGIPYWSFSRGWKFLQEAKAHFKLLERVDREILL